MHRQKENNNKDNKDMEVKDLKHIYIINGQEVFLTAKSNMPEDIKPLCYGDKMISCYPLSVVNHLPNGFDLKSYDDKVRNTYKKVKLISTYVRDTRNTCRLVCPWVSEEYAAYDYVERMLCTETTRWWDYRSMLSTFMKRLDRRYGGSISDEEYLKVEREWLAIVNQIVTEAKKLYNVQEITNNIPSIDDILGKLFIGHNIIKK